MSLSAIWTVFCDVGGPKCEGWMAEADTKAEAAKIARAAGWKRKAHVGWVCPKRRYEVAIVEPEP